MDKNRTKVVKERIFPYTNVTLLTSNFNQEINQDVSQLKNHIFLWPQIDKLFNSETFSRCYQLNCKPLGITLTHLRVFVATRLRL